MKWSLKLGTFAGIAVYVHTTFLVLLGWIAGAHLLQGKGAGATASGIGFIVAIFACVLLHEFGHALVAKRFGIKTRDITLLPIGGLARLERMPEDPKQEFLVAIAGPAVNGVIAAVLFVVILLSGGLEAFEQLDIVSGSFLERMMIVNVILLVFNLIPAFPMDGGRVLRAVLATRQSYVRATQTAAGVGQAIALVFGLIGLFLNPFLVFIALFVWIGASSEASMVLMKASLGGIPVNSAMITEYEALAATEPLARAVELTLAGSQKDFPVLDGEKVVGVLVQKDLLAALARNELQSPVSEFMQRDVQFAHANEMLDLIFRRLGESKCQTLPVTRKGKLVGLVTMDNIGEFLSIHAALDGKTRAKGVPA
ncbi:MAG: Zn-dependent protease/CBS domain-containing protein [Planctomycetota bacterium]|jgi:Zn-dependent protease/CBS domain-containing protein